jgi:hypothetical protein
MRRKWLLFGVFVAAVLVAGYLLVPFEAPRVSKANCEKIQLGWSREQVVSLLGEPPFPLSEQGLSQVSACQIWWEDDGGYLTVEFKKDGGTFLVAAAGFAPSELSFLERMRNRIERRLKAVRP